MVPYRFLGLTGLFSLLNVCLGSGLIHYVCRLAVQLASLNTRADLLNRNARTTIRRLEIHTALP
jgi:hypothetical protein